MVKNIYFVEIPFSNFGNKKGRPILLFKELENDFLFLPLTTNLQRNGVIIEQKDLEKGTIKNKSIIIVPKIGTVDKKLIAKSRYFATIKNSKFLEVNSFICKSLECD